MVLVWLASGLYIVVEGQRGVVLTLGKFSEITNSGLRWRMPYPIQSHEIVDLTGVRTVEIGYRNNVKTKVLREALMLTDDENIIDIQFAVQYTLKDPSEFLFNNRRPEEAVMRDDALRAHLRASPLCDGAARTRQFERLLLAIWRRRLKG